MSNKFRASITFGEDSTLTLDEVTQSLAGLFPGGALEVKQVGVRTPKLTDAQKAEIVEIRANDPTHTYDSLAALFGVSKGTINMVCRAAGLTRVYGKRAVEAAAKAAAAAEAEAAPVSAE